MMKQNWQQATIMEFWLKLIFKDKNLGIPDSLDMLYNE